MAEKQNDGGQAFPQPLTFDAGGIAIAAYPGMSLRDWFAGQAMIALASNSAWELLEPVAQSNFAQTAYELADAMLAERSK